ncbi:hypothetical protein MMC22_007037 [Lobaria immixta]|nr:hypothetical protein [Lobaria immixta]
MIFRTFYALSVLVLPTAIQGAQPSAPPPTQAPLRDLPWGQLNFLHTTDTHGWHAGHLQDADWGDYISFAERLRERADKEGVDLLLIDTGDRIEGNGLYDASDPKGLYTSDIFKEQKIDVICVGNHELYRQNASENEFLTTVPNYKGNYLASNVDIFDPKSGDRVPLAPRFKKFTTKNQGIRVLAFGFIFDFTGNANNTVVQSVRDTIKEKWFQEAIRDRDVDLFLVSGHVPLRSEEFNSIFKAIREVQWDTPIQFFGGHTHVRDYSKYDSKAFALESGRYMETIGFMSITGLATGGKRNDPISDALKDSIAPLATPKFARRYIDNNLFSYYHHTSLNGTSFPTSRGRNVSAMISLARKALNLDTRFGCAPLDLWTNRAPYPSKNSIFTWLQDFVFPEMIHDADREGKPTLALTNTGALRFDIFEGAFTIDTTYSVSPFTNGFRYIADVPFNVAKKLLLVLNNEPPGLGSAAHTLRAMPPVSSEHLAVYQENHHFKASLAGDSLYQAVLGDEYPDLSPGYTTVDDAGADGDDTVHSPIKFYKVPTFIESRIGLISTASKRQKSPDTIQNAEDPEVVDLVYIEFVQEQILLALKFLGADYGEEDTDLYMEGVTLTTLIGKWVRENWNGEC